MKRYLFALLLSVLCGAPALAAPSAADIPEVLKPWRAWVLHGEGARSCPEVAGGHSRDFCAWPGELKLEVRQGGMQFSQVWELQQESAVPLPGSREYWPQQVTVGGRAHPVLARNGRPAVWLPPGRHAVSGWIPWLERPQAINVPENIALVSLVVDGRLVLPLERHEGSLALGEKGGEKRGDVRQGDSVDFQVYRKLADGIPARLTTRVRFKVSGKARELSLPDILPANFVPVNIASPWVTRLDQDGRLLVQAMPGQATLEIEARLERHLKSVTPRLPPDRAQEVWSYEAAPALRATTVSPNEEGGRMLAVDPRQAGVPEDWLLLPAFVVSAGAKIQVEERTRGQSDGENQRLTLRREMWLDFSGEGFFARDRIEGTMRQGFDVAPQAAQERSEAGADTGTDTDAEKKPGGQSWRFDVAQPYVLERADSLAALAESTNWGGRQLAINALPGAQGLMAALLVTHGKDDLRLTGVEWRQPEVTLNAGVRLKAGASQRVPVTGWQQSFDRVETVLHLPYGYKLIAAPGADGVSANAWVERWTILDVFLAAFFSLLAWRLFGRAGGLAAAAYLVLAMPEGGAPIESFAAVVILALLHQAMPPGRLRGLLRGGERIALLCLVGAAIFFIPTQIRYALYPQLEEQATAWPRAVAERDAAAPESLSEAAMDRMNMDEIAAPIMAESAPLAMKKERSLSRPKPDTRVSSSARAQPRQRYTQSTVTQTGGGEPAWELGQQYRLHWSGPVVGTQEVRFLMSPPWLTRFLRVLMLGLLCTLVWLAIRTAFPGASPPAWLNFSAAASRFSRSPSSSPSSAMLALCLAALLAGGLGFSAPAAAEPAFPPDVLLDRLKSRLLEAPVCAPQCVDVGEARIDAEAKVLRVVLTAHVEASSSLALPEPDEFLTLRAVRVNGEPRPVLRVEGESYIALLRGIHHVLLEYVPSGETASLRFPIRPARVEFAGTGWQVEGIDESRFLSETLNFSRSQVEAPTTQEGVALPERVVQQFPTFVHVQRDLDIDLDWSVHTQVRRVSPVEGGFTLPVPLLQGEHVTTPDVKVQDRHALAVLTARANTASWTSRLDRPETIDKPRTVELTAPPLSERSETWRVSVSPSWHLEWNGVPVTQPEPGRAGEHLVLEFHPRAGETLVLTLTQPVKTEGSVRAIDSVALKSNVGQHAVDYTLAFRLRASQGGEHRIVLPPELKLLDVQRDNVNMNLQARGNSLSLPISPGVQTYVLRLRGDEDVGLLMSSPAIDLGLPMANVELQATLGKDRWILAASGPAVGPAVLYWGELLVALLFAFLLAKSGVSSLARWQWFLLVLGFSTFSWLTLAFIVLWLLVIEWRARSASCLGWSALKFNAMQAGIVALTLGMLHKLVSTVPAGLLSVPDMGIRGYGSGSGQLNWFADQSEALLPVARVFSLPIWVYRLLMLAWTLWLAYALIRWLSRGLSAWLKDGHWKRFDWTWRSAKKAQLPGPSEGK